LERFLEAAALEMRQDRGLSRPLALKESDQDIVIQCIRFDKPGPGKRLRPGADQSVHYRGCGGGTAMAADLETLEFPTRIDHQHLVQEPAGMP
jgi:hypothetical protein